MLHSFLIDISYSLSFEKVVCITENKKRKEDKKKLMQSCFCENLAGFHIDKPRRNTNNSHDRNTAKRFFKTINVLFCINEASRGAAARSVTVKPAGCGFDPHSTR